MALKTADVQELLKTSNAQHRLAKAWQSGLIKTIEDLEYATYGFVPSGGQSRLAKDAAVTIDTTGFTNNIYGAKLFRQIITGYNALGAVGFKPWNTNGYRIITAAAATTNPGVTIGGAIPATLKPTAANVDISPTLSAVSFEMTSTALKANPKNDGVSWEEWQAYMADEFRNRLNREFLADNDTARTVGIYSLDTIIASYAEIAYGKMDDSAVLDANDLDIYGQDRDASASTFDAYVNGLAFGSADHTFELSYLDACFTNCRPYWNNRMNENKVLITNDDTAMRITQLHAAMGLAQLPPKRVNFTVNGIKSVSGVDVGVEVAAYNGVPIIPDSIVLQDTIGRIYLCDLDNLHIGALTPPSYLESDDYQGLDKFAREGVYYMEGEVVCTNFPAQGKVRDLK